MVGRAPPAACPQGQRCHLNICHFVQLRVIARPQRLLCIIYRGKTVCCEGRVRGREPRQHFCPPSLFPKHIKARRRNYLIPPLLPVSSSAVCTISSPAQDHQRRSLLVMCLSSAATLVHCLVKDSESYCKVTGDVLCEEERILTLRTEKKKK